MKIIWFLLFIAVTMIYVFYYHYHNESYMSAYVKETTPRLIHLIYLPWDANQKLKADSNDFDKTFYKELQESNPNYVVKMWTLPDCRQFVRKYYPDYEQVIFNAPRPVMMVDILRLLIVYHFGGIYWQYESKPLTSMDSFLPSNEKNVKLFTEIIISDEFANKMSAEPIRDGNPEERVRVCTQIFSAVPRHPYLFALFEKTINNVQTYPIRRDYDILYTTGNAMMSTMYDKVGQHYDDVELMDENVISKMASISSNGSWRIKKI